MRGRTLLSMAAVVLAVSTSARATTMQTLDLPTLVARSQQVVLGHVTKTESHYTDDRSTIYTEVTLTVTRGYKGAAAGQTVTLRHEGGSVDGIGAKVEGAPRFVVGEDVVVFVGARGGHQVVVGMAQGKLNVSTVAGQKIVAANLSGLELLPNAAPVGRRTLSDLEQAIAKEVERQAKPQK